MFFVSKMVAPSYRKHSSEAGWLLYKCLWKCIVVAFTLLGAFGQVSLERKTCMYHMADTSH